MVTEIERKIAEAIEKIKHKHSQGEHPPLKDSKWTIAVERADVLAYEGASLDDIIKLLEESGVSEDQFKEAMKYIQESGRKKYIKKVKDKCAEMKNNGESIEKIKEHLGTTKLTEEEKNEIISELGTNNQSNLQNTGKKILEKAKNIGIGVSITLLLAVFLIIYFLINLFNK